MSAYSKFCPISIREIFYALKEILGQDHPLVRQLVWREFFYVLAYHFPQVFTQNFNEKYKDLQEQWYEDENDFYFNKWKNAQTGFPFVDAGMRELNATGWMHNRLRMVTANFLCKDLFINWKKGERYFAQILVDYDPCVNNGNWQWNAGTGVDPEKYGGPRIFNPWLQSEKFDSKVLYIKKWIPELKDVSAKHIHEWHKQYEKYPEVNYPKPLVDHAVQARKARTFYASFKKK